MKKLGLKIKSNVKALSVTAICCIAAGVTLYYVPAFKAGSATYSLRDVTAVASLQSRVAEAVGAAAPGYRGAAETLAIAGIQKQVLAAQKAGLNSQVAMQLVEQRAVAPGFLLAAKKSMGEDRYYRTVIEPVALGEVFVAYYNTNDPARKAASAALSVARQAGVSVVAQQQNLKVEQLQVPVENPANAAFVVKCKAVGINGVVDAVIEDAAGFMVVQARGITDQVVSADVVRVPRTPFGKFLLDQAKENKISIRTMPWFPWSTSRLKE